MNLYSNPPAGSNGINQNGTPDNFANAPKEYVSSTVKRESPISDEPARGETTRFPA